MSLVTIIIATYNSSVFVAEALESVRNQSWANIELIITDDFSTDDTLEVCHSWLQNNKNRFVRTEILASEENCGISGNLNKGLNYAKGEWISFLAGDDTLLPDCIENNMHFIDENNEVKILFSKADVYRDTFEESNFIRTIPGGEINSNSIIWRFRAANSQYKMLLVCDRIHFSPSAFFHTETVKNIGGFDERFRTMEDYTLWLNLTKNGYKLHFMDKITVNYRMHSNAINNTGNNYLVNPNYFKQEDFRKIYTYPNLPIDIRLCQRFNWCLSQIFRCKCLNRRTRINSIIHSFLTVYLNPFRYYIWLRKRLNKNLKDNEFYM